MHHQVSASGIDIKEWDRMVRNMTWINLNVSLYAYARLSSMWSYKTYIFPVWDRTTLLHVFFCYSEQIVQSLEVARLGVEIVISLWNLTGVPAALLPRLLSNSRVIWPFSIHISRLRDFTKFRNQTFYSLVNKSPDVLLWQHGIHSKRINVTYHDGMSCAFINIHVQPRDNNLGP